MRLGDAMKEAAEATDELLLALLRWRFSLSELLAWIRKGKEQNEH